MMIFLACLCTALATGCAAFMLGRRGTGRLRAERDGLAAELAAARGELAHQRELAEQSESLTASRHSLELDAQKKQFEDQLRLYETLGRTRLEEQQKRFDTTLGARDASIKELRENFERSRAEAAKTSAAQLEQLKTEFKELSVRLLEEKQNKLKTANEEHLASLLNPLRERMNEFKLAVEAAKAKEIELNTSLTTQLRRMMEETSRIGGEARNLADALKGGQKMQGDWGELILEDILSRSGLQEGVHYERQETLRDGSGQAIRNPDSDKLMRPDVLVHYPDNKDIIIDSKTSLSAYVDFMNAPDDAVRQDALTRHLRSVNSHVDELAQKNYSAWAGAGGRDTVDFVVMFVPNEGSYQLAMINDPALWDRAFKRKVMIVSPCNLMALLKIIHIAWARDDQSRNQQAIIATAVQLTDRLYAFYEDFDRLGDSIENTRTAFQKATNRLKQGERNRSVVLAGEKLRRLGIKLSKEKTLPAALQPDERTLMELPETPEAASEE